MIAVRSFLASLPVDEGSNEPSGQNELPTNRGDNESQCQDDLENAELPRLTRDNLSYFDDNSFNHDKNKQTTSSTMSAKTSKTINYTDADFIAELEMRNVVFDSESLPHNWEQTIQQINPSVEAPTAGVPTTTAPVEVSAGVPAEALVMMPTSPRLERAKRILLAAPNEATVTWAVAPVLVSIDWLILSPTYDAVPDANWKSPSLPPIDDTDGKLTTPKPDLTVGYKHTNIQAYKSIAELKPFSTPVICRSGLIFPSFTLENKGLESTHYSVLQNRLNAAHMLRNFYTLRSRAGDPSWESQFYGRITVITASLSKDKIGIYGHWVGQDHKYHSCALKTWPTEYGDYAEIWYSMTIAIDTILENNRPWITSDLRRVSESSRLEKRARTSDTQSQIIKRSKK